MTPLIEQIKKAAAFDEQNIRRETFNERLWFAIEYTAYQLLEAKVKELTNKNSHFLQLNSSKDAKILELEAKVKKLQKENDKLSEEVTHYKSLYEDLLVEVDEMRGNK